VFKPSKVHHSHCKEQCQPFVPERFSLLSWNIYKKNRSDRRFRSFLTTRFDVMPDFMLLQEAQFDPQTGCILENFSFEAAANLETDNRYYGVLTASRIAVQESKAFLSGEKEAFIGTHKSLLLSKYLFDHGKELLLVNIHAINFRENGAYEKEKQRLLSFLSAYSGAVILAGDFNTWSGSRLRILLEITESLGLKRVPFSKEDGVKSFMGNHLDMIFYRGVELRSYEVLDDGAISDHRPLLAIFEKKVSITAKNT